MINVRTNRGSEENERIWQGCRVKFNRDVTNGLESLEGKPRSSQKARPLSQGDRYAQNTAFTITIVKVFDEDKKRERNGNSDALAQI